MNIVYISRVQMNPYVKLLSSAMEQVATRVDCVVSDTISPKWLWHRRDHIDVLHFHWAELLYSSATWKGMSLKWLRLASTVLLAKLLRIRVAYTVHNLAHHEGENALLNRLTNRLVFRFADVIHVHDESVRQAVAQRFNRRRGVAVIPHGNYLSYANTCSKEEARARFDIPASAFVYLFLGQIRPYKGVEELLKAFAKLPDSDARLIIAGNAHSPDYARSIQQLAGQDARILLHLSYVPEDELQYYMNAGDIFVLPYRHVTTSGAAILAFSFGKPVIAPALGAFPELLQEGRGLPYDPREKSALLKALQRARALDLDRGGSAALALARELDWIGIAQQHLTAYDSLPDTF